MAGNKISHTIIIKNTYSILVFATPKNDPHKARTHATHARYARTTQRVRVSRRESRADTTRTSCARVTHACASCVRARRACVRVVRARRACASCVRVVRACASCNAKSPTPKSGAPRRALCARRARVRHALRYTTQHATPSRSSSMVATAPIAGTFAHPVSAIASSTTFPMYARTLFTAL